MRICCQDLLQLCRDLGPRPFYVLFQGPRLKNNYLICPIFDRKTEQFQSNLGLNNKTKPFVSFDTKLIQVSASFQ